jgi:Zn-dependent protease/CBS domain-containing protein
MQNSFTSSFKIGQILGINIRIDWSWLLIFLLVTWNLSAGFADIHSDWEVGLTWGLALVAALLFFGSVLAHEMAHSLVARTQGVPVRSITLFIFGGVADIQREPPSPRSEFLITIVGPATSIVLGVIFVIAGSILAGPVDNFGQSTDMFESFGPLTTIVVWLGSINLVLGVFNLIPGFPLDGGRLLRSTLWAVTDNLRKATRWAAWVGQSVAGLLFVSGVGMIFGAEIPILGTGVINGLWLIFIGWFLNNAAVQSYRRIVVQDILADVPVSRIMRHDPPVVSSNISVRDLVDNHIMKLDDHAFPVVEDGQLVGLVTLNDVRSIEQEAWDSRQVRDIMTTSENLVTTLPDEDAADAMTKLMKHDVRQLPVIQNDHTVSGILRRSDVIKWLQLHAEG